MMNKHFAYISVVLILFAIIMYLHATMYCKEDDGQCRTSSYAVMGVSIFVVLVIGGYIAYKIFVQDFVRNRAAKAARIEMNLKGQRRTQFLKANQERFEQADADTTKRIEALGRVPNAFDKTIDKNRPEYEGYTKAIVTGRGPKAQGQQGQGRQQQQQQGGGYYGRPGGRL